MRGGLTLFLTFAVKGAGWRSLTFLDYRAYGVGTRTNNARRLYIIHPSYDLVDKPPVFIS